MRNIRATITQHASAHSLGRVTVENFIKGEVERFEGFLNGNNTARIVDGRLVTRPLREPLPDPIEDKEMYPFWRKPSRQDMTALSSADLQGEMFDQERYDRAYSRSITITHLCGHYYTEESYKEQATKLTSYGFIQLRSQRGEDGRYWEYWILPALWATQGDLSHIVETIKLRAKDWHDPTGEKVNKECFETVIKFLCQNVIFGSLDVSVQRAAMPNPE